jgi:gliding motility-associated-like protein
MDSSCLPGAFRVPLHFLFCIHLMWTAESMSGQNLVPNPNFETFSNCPYSISQINFAPPWYTPTVASPDYFNSCTTTFGIDVPNNFGGYQFPLNGEGYLGCFFKAPQDYREYLQVQLDSPLEEGVCYQIGYFLNAANQYCGVAEGGIFISSFAPSSGGFIALPYTPQITGNGGYYSDTVAWVEITGLYLAQGGEQFLTIGNFKLDDETPTDPMCQTSPEYSYYYVDSVYVVDAGPIDPLPLELGPPVVTCEEFEIDGESGDVTYEWSDGSQGSTLSVSSTGVYSLTISQGCSVGIDSVEVTFPYSPPVQINPGMVSICEGESYTITLDPDAGEYIWNDGTMDPVYTITSPGLYSVTMDDGCALSSDDILVEVNLLPLPFNLGNDTILCEGDEFDLTLDPGTNDVFWQNGTNVSIYTISQPGVYAVTISNGCGEVTDEIEVEGLQVPQVDLGPDTLSRCDSDVIQFDFDPGLGSFLWSDESVEPFFFVFSPGVYSVTVTNQCGIGIDTVTVYDATEPSVGFADTITLCTSALPFTLSPAVTAPGDNLIWSTGETTSQITVSGPGDFAVTISNGCYTVSDTVHLDTITTPVLNLPETGLLCSGDTLLLNASVPLATYLWQDGSTLSTFEVTGSGSYAVTVTTACGVNQDSVEVTAIPLLDPPDLGPDFSLCFGEQATLYANAGNGSYQWSDMSTADTLLVITPGVYSVTVQNQCASATDTIQVTSSNAPPDVDLPSSLTLCQGQSLSIDANISGVSYLWSDGTTTPSLSISSPGSYSLTVTNSCGTDADTVVIIDAGALPAIALGDDLALCPGDTQILAPDFSNADNWVWQDGSTDSTYIINAAGQVTIEVSNGCGSVYDTLDIVFLPPVPILNLGTDTALCSSDLLLLEVDIQDVTITWFDGSQGDQVAVTGAGIYTAQIESASGVSTDTLVVSPLPDIPQLSLGPDQLLCPGEILTFNPGIADVQYEWQDGTVAPSFSTTQTGLVILTISNACGASTDSLLITESTDGPQLDLGPDVTGCEGSTVTIQSGITGVTYTWQDGSANPFFEVADDAVLTLQIANACGMDEDTIAVHFIAAPDPNLGPDTVLCDNQVLTLTSIPQPVTSIMWQDGSQVSTFLVTTPGVYTLQYANVCGDKTDTIVVSYLASPEPFTLGSDVVLCPGESILLQAPSTMDQLLWQDGADSFMITANQSQLYALTIFNACGSVYDEINVQIDSAVPQVPFENREICPGEVLTLDASQPFEAQYFWSTGALNSSIDVRQPGEYMVTVTTPCYVLSNTAIVLQADDCASDALYFIPNVFSPNGDAVNDLFFVQFNADAEIISLTGDIFDRWGNHVYGSNEQSFSWDGTLNGTPMNPGVYVYQFILTYTDGVDVVTKKVVGDVTMIR